MGLYLENRGLFQWMKKPSVRNSSETIIQSKGIRNWTLLGPTYLKKIKKVRKVKGASKNVGHQDRNCEEKKEVIKGSNRALGGSQG
ncbi:hypothetical protein Ancab_005540, partial [Ancistrocladus abbreviatus]